MEEKIGRKWQYHMAHVLCMLDNCGYRICNILLLHVSVTLYVYCVSCFF
jgi:hypothetical protein